MNLYMAVTPDKLELPLCEEDTAKGLAEKLGMTLNAVLSACAPSKSAKNGERRGYRIIRVRIEDEGENH